MMFNTDFCLNDKIAFISARSSAREQIEITIIRLRCKSLFRIRISLQYRDNYAHNICTIGNCDYKKD